MLFYNLLYSNFNLKVSIYFIGDYMKNLYLDLKPITDNLIDLLFKPTITYQEEIPTNEKIILAGNHMSNFDPLLLARGVDRQIHFLAKYQLFKGPLKFLMNNIESILVKRDGNDIECLKKATYYLKEEKCLGIFPEGTFNKTDNLILPFKLGTIMIAKRSKSDIIPFSITGNYKLVKNNLRLSFGKRIKTSDYSSKELLEKLESDVKTLILKNR